MSRVVEIEPERVKQDVNLFQSAFWAHFKQEQGYETQVFEIEHRGWKSPLVLVHRPCAGDSAFGYVPHGPGVAVPQDRQGPFLEFVSEEIRQRLPEACRFLRYDLPWPSPYGDRDASGGVQEGPPEPRVREMRMNFGSRNWNLRKAPTDMHPPDTVVLELTKTTACILAEMHPKARYGIRSAFRRGIRVEHGERKHLPAWHALYLDMTERKGIVAEDLTYFEKLLAAARVHEPDLRLYLAFRGKEPVAGSIVAFQGETATYLYSASSIPGRRLMASYAVLWKAVMEAKLHGCRWFDLFGIPSTAEPGHPMHGLYRFKTRFGGDIRRLRGCWDYPFDQEQYSFLSFADGYRDRYHRK